jgi:hypothetical protein
VVPYNAFVETPLQGPIDSAIVDAGFGLHAGSFAEFTLSDTTGWFFWPKVEKAGYTDFWEHGVMGGELGPQEIAFSGEYPSAEDEFEQDFSECTRIIHATYMVNDVSYESGYGDSSEVNRALDAARQMGYNFQKSQRWQRYPMLTVAPLSRWM